MSENLQEPTGGHATIFPEHASRHVFLLDEHIPEIGKRVPIARGHVGYLRILGSSPRPRPTPETLEQPVHEKRKAIVQALAAFCTRIFHKTTRHFQ